jgi:hypothetical protein
VNHTHKHNPNVGGPAGHKSQAARGNGEAPSRSKIVPPARESGPGDFISVAVPENKKRGRPAKFAREALGHVARGFGRGCLRTHQNHAYLTHALQVLGLHPRWAWFGIDKKAVMEKPGKHRRLRTTVLAELGRIENPAAIKAVAKALIMSKPVSDRVAIQFVRDRRKGGVVPFKHVDLVNQILKLAKGYKRDCKQCRWNDIEFALRAATGHLQNNVYMENRRIQEEQEILRSLRAEGYDV